ncbi:MAG: hypothetical protein A2V70_20080 [Planctomycetes bacterium RBG_13_63_9]|nr:MAG: hypothetical protein A2V70_20080 [Planctomycetes bacterium RBG_13_63_9]
MAVNDAFTSAEPLRDAVDGPMGRIGFGGEAEELLGPPPHTMSESQQAIRDMVIRLLEGTRSDEERRWSPRVPFVRLARLYFDQGEGPDSDRGSGVLVATTDISSEGAGVLCWQEIPVRRLQLELPGVRFACEVCWSRRMGHHIYRYGLHFRSLLDRAT